ncbi:MAG: hypothetical protein QF552_07035 [Litorilituus sp.]|jgi:small basic protein|nr:hypothetical protein [Litorilituus sp.]
MKTLNRTNISVALLFTMGTVFSVNVNAAETNAIENSISEMVLAQGEQVMSELTAQLQQSISQEINSFTIDFSFEETVIDSIAWITDEESTSIAKTKQSEQETQNQQPKTKSL